MTEPASPQLLWECYWSSGSASGTRQIWAPDADTAVATIEQNPSMFGIPHEHPIVGHPTRLDVLEANELEVFDDRAA